jgi:hypothetical protein
MNHDPLTRRDFLKLAADRVVEGLFKNDDDIASVSWLRAMKMKTKLKEVDKPYV